MTEEMGFPKGLGGQESACTAGDLGSIPGSGRCLEEGNGTPLQCSCLENPIERWEGGGREVQERGDICICTADSQVAQW